MHPQYTPIQINEFLSKTDQSAPFGNWLWLGSLYPNGYGRFWIDGKMRLAHRVAYEMFVGEIPDGLDVLHTCPGGDRKDCVSPAHLRVGTQSDNMRDAMERGFRPAFPEDHPVPIGEESGNARLREIDISTIRRRAIDTGESCRAIALDFAVSTQAIRDILTGRTWWHVPIDSDLPTRGGKLVLPRRVGADHCQSALTHEQRDMVVGAFNSGGWTQMSLAREYGVSRSVIGHVLHDAGIRVGRGNRPGNHVARGERLGHAKLTEDDVRAIRQLSAVGVLHVRLAELYGVTDTTVAAVVHRKTWRHV